MAQYRGTKQISGKIFNIAGKVPISASWENASTLPYEFYNGSAVVYNNEIHIMGSEYYDSNNRSYPYMQYHYKYNGSTWTSVSTLPYDFYKGSAVVYNNEIHIMGGYIRTSHYKYDGSTWTSVSTLPYEFYYGSAVVYNNEIHIMGSGYYDSNRSYPYSRYHYKYNGSTWTSVSTLPYNFYFSDAVVYNNEIHIMGSYDNKTTHYKYDGSTWTSVSTLPYEFYFSDAVVYNNEIHIMGSGNSSYYTSHYKYDGSTWTSVSTLPYEFYYGSAVVYNNEIHIMGSGYFDSNGGSYLYIKSHYKYVLTYDTSGDLSYLKYLDNLLSQYGDTRDTIVTFTSNDSTEIPSSWTSVELMESDSTMNVLLSKISTMIKNVRYIGSVVDTLEQNFNNNMKSCYDTCVGLNATPKSQSPKDIAKAIDEVYNISYQSGITSMRVGTATTDKVLSPFIFASNDGLALQGIAKNRGDLVINKIGSYGSGYYSSITVNEAKHIIDTTGESVSTLPYDFYCSSAVVYNKEIHILGSGNGSNYTSHYKYNGSTWTSVSTLPYNFCWGSAVAYSNEIHIMGSYDSSYRKYHYKYDGSTWTSVSTLPYEFYDGSAVVYNNEIHIMGSGYYYNRSHPYVKYHYKYNGSTWTSVSTLPYEFYQGAAVVYNNEIHIMGSHASSSYYKYHYKYDGSTWTSVSTLPYDFYCSSAIVYSNEIHILGGYSSRTAHYKYDGSTWTSVSTLPYEFYYGSAVVYNNEIHILGSSSSSSYYKYHYKAYENNSNPGWVYVDF